MEQSTKVFGKVTFSMAKEQKYGQTDPYIKETIFKEKSKELVPICGLIIPNMKENGLII